MFEGFAVNGDICVRSGRRNALEEGFKHDEFDKKSKPGDDWPISRAGRMISAALLTRQVRTLRTQ